MLHDSFIRVKRRINICGRRIDVREAERGETGAGERQGERKWAKRGKGETHKHYDAKRGREGGVGEHVEKQ